VGLPVTAFVDRTGRVAHVHHGPLDADALIAAVADRLALP